LARGLQSELDALEANRPEILNLSSQIQNQYSNLQVATQAAEFQAEESDISLANTLATARQTGLGAGGATALAQAALRSKRDISSSIEQQEARNILLRAQGAEKAQTDRIAQANKEFAIRESRSMQALDRTSNLLDQANARAMANKQASQAAIAGAIGAAAGAGIGAALGMGPKPTQASTTQPSTSGSTTGRGAEGLRTQTPNSIMDSSGNLKTMEPLQFTQSLFSSGEPTGEAAMAAAFAKDAEAAKVFNPRALTPSPWGYNPLMVPGAGSNEFNARQAYPNRPSFYTRYTRLGVDQYDPNTLKYYKR